jgi:hypothetical protein
VARAVKFARAQGIRIAPQGTGHGSLSLEPLEDAMLLRTDRMRKQPRDQDEPWRTWHGTGQLDADLLTSLTTPARPVVPCERMPLPRVPAKRP